ncbi:hypothetical protein DAPPUDRAFT_254542 [Daphnia pulex]|uniref:Uncharacterized protein n=1 Tax=Daphnia pulex TaxID=6669 RepID=E9H7A4_DAPPU|nr:hypothetical protein DAPPUDRAFT_254542 [Daphnia pulex]|eukprot:EFX72344.1 hypothetical protein DAPPUDRAFT_254542 [Daphnia pulex]
MLFPIQGTDPELGPYEEATKPEPLSFARRVVTLEKLHETLTRSYAALTRLLPNGLSLVHQPVVVQIPSMV